jgi:DNA polymerase (family 10)
MQNAGIADRLDAFAALLELAEANPYTTRAYRRAAETIRSTPLSVAELVRSGQARQLRGIGSGIEVRLRELVETGEIAELAELERELTPELVGLGRFLGLSARRSMQIASALGVRTAEEFRTAAAAGRLRDVPGIGPKIETQLLDALAREREPRPRRGLLINRAWELLGGIADALGGEVAGDARRYRDSCESLIVICATSDPGPVLDRFATLPQVVAVIDRNASRGVGGDGRWGAGRADCRRPGALRLRTRPRHRLATIRRGAGTAPGFGE